MAYFGKAAMNTSYEKFKEDPNIETKLKFRVPASDKHYSSILSKIHEKENKLLQIMMEDESTWLSTLVEDSKVTPDNFFDVLRDGVVLCRLANIIQDYAIDKSKKENTTPLGNYVKYFSKERCKTDQSMFMARDNVHKFLKWCRAHKLPEPMLFESNDCVESDRAGGREIIICLMNLARRFCHSYNVPAPMMVQLEDEIDEAESQCDIIENTKKEDKNLQNEVRIEFVIPKTEVEKPKNELEKSSSSEPKMPKSKSKKKLESDAEDEAQSILDQYDLDGLQIQITEGRFKIRNKYVFIRKINNHLLVRIGGGWEPLEVFLAKNFKKLDSSIKKIHFSNSIDLTKETIEEAVVKMSEHSSKQSLYCLDKSKPTDTIQQLNTDSVDDTIANTFSNQSSFVGTVCDSSHVSDVYSDLKSDQTKDDSCQNSSIVNNEMMQDNSDSFKNKNKTEDSQETCNEVEIDDMKQAKNFEKQNSTNADVNEDESFNDYKTLDSQKQKDSREAINDLKNMSENQEAKDLENVTGDSIAEETEKCDGQNSKSSIFNENDLNSKSSSFNENEQNSKSSSFNENEQNSKSSSLNNTDQDKKEEKCTFINSKENICNEPTNIDPMSENTAELTDASINCMTAEQDVNFLSARELNENTTENNQSVNSKAVPTDDDVSDSEALISEQENKLEPSILQNDKKGEPQVKESSNNNNIFYVIEKSTEQTSDNYVISQVDGKSETKHSNDDVEQLKNNRNERKSSLRIPLNNNIKKSDEKSDKHLSSEYSENNKKGDKPSKLSNVKTPENLKSADRKSQIRNQNSPNKLKVTEKPHFSKQGSMTNIVRKSPNLKPSKHSLNQYESGGFEYRKPEEGDVIDFVTLNINRAKYGGVKKNEAHKQLKKQFRLEK